MAVNHSTTTAALNSIISGVSAIAKAYKEYKAAPDDKADKAMYSAQYLKGQADKKLENLIATAQAKEQAFDKALADARAAEKKNAESVDFSDERVAILMDNLGRVTVKKMLYFQTITSAFIGEAAPLALIREQIEQNGEAIPDNMADTFFDPDTLFDELESRLIDLVRDPAGAGRLQPITAEVERIAEILGIDGVSTDIGVDKGALYGEAMRQAMGLD